MIQWKWFFLAFSSNRAKVGKSEKLRETGNARERLQINGYTYMVMQSKL